MVVSLGDALSLKSDGTDLFRHGEFHRALDKFSRALDQLPPTDDVQHHRSTLLCNRAITYNRLEMFAEAERDASAAIRFNPSNVKAYYHRMMSRRRLNDVRGFKSDFEKFSQLKGHTEDCPDPGYLNCIDAAIVQAVTVPADDDTFMMVSSAWWTRFRAYYGYAGDHPGPIDNLPLIDHRASDERDPMRSDSDSRSPKLDQIGDAFDVCQEPPRRAALPPFDDGLVLRPDLQKDVDYVIVPEHVWKPLSQQFLGGLEIRRPVRVVPCVDAAPIVDVLLRPISIAVQRVDDLPGASIRIVLACSPCDTVLDVIRAVCSVCTAAASEIRAVKRVDDAYEVVPPKLRLRDVGLGDGSVLFVERRTTNGFWPCSKSVAAKPQGESEICSACFDSIPPSTAKVVCEVCRHAIYCSVRCRRSHSRWHDKLDHRSDRPAGRGRSPGTSGLMNIGNSCYINAALQCLSSAHELTRSFLSDDFVPELNRDNPLGSKGRLAEAYADLLKEMWFGDATYYDPREFKRAVSCFATQFASCQQQDAQEFLAFLLDGIHEDLNRIRTKPYLPKADSGDRPDEVVAQEQWSNYLARNQSVVMDCLLGQFKSEVICAASSNCRPSVTFDPFIYVSLPLPEPVRIVPVLYYPVSGDVPTVLHVKVDRLSVTSLEMAIQPVLAERPDFAPGNQLIFACLTQSRPLCLLPKSNQPVDMSPSQELAVFEIRPRCIPVSCIIRQIPRSANESSVLFRGRPFIVDFSLENGRRLTGMQIYLRIYQFLFRSFRHPDLEPSFRIEMFCNNEKTDIPKTDDPVDLRYFMRPVVVVAYQTDDLLRELNMEELQRVDNGGEGFVPPPTVPALSIYDCLKAFTKTESLGVNDWVCSSCHKEGNASKRMSFWRLPDVLILHLKRFDSVRRHALFGEAANKISKEVQFPLKDLDLSPFVSTKEADRPVPRYELFGVINHYGASFFGHYTAFTKGLDGVWRHFDDDLVKVVSPEEICQSNAYLLFYRQQSE